MSVALIACGARTSLDESMFVASAGATDPGSGGSAGSVVSQAGAPTRGGATSIAGAASAGMSSGGTRAGGVASTGGVSSAGSAMGGAAMGGASAGAAGSTAGAGGSTNPPLTVEQIVTTGVETCALASNGTVKCWGYDAYGELGYGNTEQLGDDELPSSLPAIQLTNRPGVVATRIGVGDNVACAALSDGSLKCWGRNSQNQLGLGNRTELSSTVPPSALPAVSVSTDAAHPIQISSYAFHTCVVLSSGAARCWGLGDLGALGTGNQRDVGDDELPSSIPPLSLTTAPNVGTTQVACGYFGCCALLSDATVKCWGAGGHGELGSGRVQVVGDDELPSAAPFASVSNGPEAIPILLSAGDFHACALLSDGNVRCWGDNQFGQLGYGNTQNIGDDELPSSIPPLPIVTKPGDRVIQIASGRDHNCALLTNGKVKCWGFNAEGQLGYARKDRSIGDDETIESLEPYSVTNEPGVVATSISAGGDVTCVTLSNGTAKCWGDNLHGQLGIGSTQNIGDDELPSSLGPIDLF